MPNILVASPPAALASKQVKDDEAIYKEYQPSQGYYADGAYVASQARITAHLHDVDDEDADPQEAYYASLLARFISLRTAFQQFPSNLPVSSTTSSLASFLHRTKTSVWRSTLLNTPPTMALLSVMTQETVVRGLRVAEGVLSRRNAGRKCLGAWCWGLLASCRSVGEMDSESVSVVRELGKKAAWVARGIRVGRRDDDHGDNNGGDPDDEEDNDEADVETELMGEAAELDLAEGEAGAGTAELMTGTEMFELGDAMTQQDDALLPPEISTTPASALSPSPKPSPLLSPDNDNDTNIDADALLASRKQSLLSAWNPALGHPSLVPEGVTAAETMAGVAMAAETMDAETMARGTEAAETLAATATVVATAVAETKAAEKDVDIDIQGTEEGSAEEGGEHDTDGATEEERQRATLDMVMTVVGEAFGQRDLLGGRDVWGE